MIEWCDDECMSLDIIKSCLWKCYRIYVLKDVIRLLENVCRAVISV